MPFTDIPLNDGHKVPSIAFGTGTALYGRDACDSVLRAITTGFSHIDTSQKYMNEESVGEAIRESGLARHEIYVTTKYSWGPVRGAIRESLRKLGLEYVDLYLIHDPKEGFESTWRELEKIKDDGLARSIGVSNFNLEQLQQVIKIAKVTPAVNQISFNPYNYAENKGLLEYSAKHGVIIEGYSSLAPITKFPGGPVDGPVNAIAERLNITTNQAIFAWAKAKGVVLVTTSSRKERLEEYLAVGDLPPLTVEDIAAIDEGGSRGPSRSLSKISQ